MQIPEMLVDLLPTRGGTTLLAVEIPALARSVAAAEALRALYAEHKLTADQQAFAARIMAAEIAMMESVFKNHSEQRKAQQEKRASRGNRG